MTRYIDADELMEHVWRDKLDSRELIAKMINNAPTVTEEFIAKSVLNKIRAEIEQIIGERNLDDYDFCSGLICARKIIDKYKSESEK